MWGDPLTPSKCVKCGLHQRKGETSSNPLKMYDCLGGFIICIKNFYRFLKIQIFLSARCSLKKWVRRLSVEDLVYKPSLSIKFLAHHVTAYFLQKKFLNKNVEKVVYINLLNVKVGKHSNAINVFVKSSNLAFSKKFETEASKIIQSVHKNHQMKYYHEC
jgi:hypothetical protein